METHRLAKYKLFEIFWIILVFSLDFFTFFVSGNWWRLSSVLNNHRAYVLGTQLRCDHLPGMSVRQTRICFDLQDHMPSVSRGAQLAIEECQHQFRNRKWNCSIFSEDETMFGPAVSANGTKETAFTHAISTAGVVHSLARSCKRGSIRRCGCSRATKPGQLQNDYVWGGCGDNVEYGIKFSKKFVDIREMEKNHPRHSKLLGRTMMNLHNNEAGRKAVFKNKKVGCKCHGVSGSCSLKTCWYQLAQFRETGNKLRRKYDHAVKVKFNRKGTKLIRANKPKRVRRDDLIYMDISPDFCKAHPKLGVYGTTGRSCKQNPRSAESCKSMCCGRGWDVRRITVSQKCNCRFHWCCYVKCQMCNKRINLYTCR